MLLKAGRRLVSLSDGWITIFWIKRNVSISSYRKRETSSSRPLPSINKFFLLRVLGHGLIMGISCEWAILVWKNQVARILQYSEAWYLGYRVVEKWSSSAFLISWQFGGNLRFWFRSFWIVTVSAKEAWEVQKEAWSKSVQHEENLIGPPAYPAFGSSILDQKQREAKTRQDQVLAKNEPGIIEYVTHLVLSPLAFRPLTFFWVAWSLLVSCRLVSLAELE